MDLFIRSIARAGGVEVPADVRMFDSPRRAGQGGALSLGVSKVLGALGAGLQRTGAGLVARARPLPEKSEAALLAS